MARTTRFLAIGLAATAAFATVVSAQQTDPLAAAVAARKAHMGLQGANLGVLGAMAQDKIPYDAEIASAAAGNLVAIASIDQRFYWLEGTQAGAVEGTRALPAIWEQPDAFAADLEDLRTAVVALEGEAGNGLDALKAAFGPVGQSCGGCHRTFRVTE